MFLKFASIVTIVLFNVNHAVSSMDMSNTVMPMLFISDRPNGSGTAWIPEKSSMYAVHSEIGKWTGMNHGSAYLRWTDQNVNNSGQRGEDAFDAPNWFMSQWDRKIKVQNQLRLRGMLSLDPLTEGNDGYPLLFQTGEALKGKPLIDRQHPHDLFMELSAAWAYNFSDQNGLFAYLGYPGEPAIGPTTFMHRPSADMITNAPLGHHWQDATHISFGVFTLGLILNNLKIDGSIFTGREPDENRWNFDRPWFDSYSGRISYRFTPNIVSQISSGYLHSPETLHPDINQVRITGSVETSFSTMKTGVLSSSLIYGGNIEIEQGTSNLTNTILVESEFALDRFIPYGRYEFAQKKSSDLGITNAEEKAFNIHAFTIGNAIRIIDFASLSLFAGAQGTMDVPESNLKTEYGTLPLSYEVYIRIRPSKMMMSEISTNHQH